MQFSNTLLKKARKNEKLSVEKAIFRLFGEGLEISSETLRKWEKGVTSPTVKQLPAICQAYRLPISYFFGLKPSKASKGSIKYRLKADRSNTAL